MNSALILFVICAAAIGAYAGEHGGKMKEAFKQCAEEKGVSKEAMDAAKHSEVTDRNIKCVYACVGKKLGMMNDDGTMNKDTDKMDFPPNMDENQKQMMKQKVQACAESSADADECEAAYKMKKCMMPPKRND